MLKKLVKYGNSHALVLDKSIMGLLELEDGDSVKLRIEGNTLIVRGEKKLAAEDAYMLELDSIEDRYEASESDGHEIMQRAKSNLASAIQEKQQSETGVKELKEWAPGTENYSKLTAAYKAVGKKYQKEIDALDSPAFREELKKLNKKYPSSTNAQKYMEELAKLRLEHAPGLIEFDREMAEVQKQLGCPGSISVS